MGRKSQIENDLENSTGHGPLVFGVGLRKRKNLGRLSNFPPGCLAAGKAGEAA